MLKMALGTDNSQLHLSFEQTGNRFSEKINSGDFVVFVELDTSFTKSDESLRVAREMVDAVNKIDYLPVSLAFTSEFGAEVDNDIISFASSLVEFKSRDKHLIYLSGSGLSYDEAIEIVYLCATEGWKNIVPVTGNSDLEKTVDEHKSIPFTDSVHLLSGISKIENKELVAGCVVNPYKYTPESLYSQFYKLVKKINLGGGFVVTQTGWDMLKLQELRWFLTSRELYTPSIARIELLTPSRVKEIVEGKSPGLHASVDFQSILANEAQISNMQFEAAQWRRLQLQVAGCKFLGYSGIQISGLKSKSHINIASRRIAEALEEFSDFNEWREAYENHLARGDMAPYPYRFYMFDGLFLTDHYDGSPSTNDAKLPECSKLEKVTYRLMQKIFSLRFNNEAINMFLRAMFFGGCSCEIDELAETHYLCMEQCPKKLKNGPCGGSKPNGDCELQDKECVHGQRMRRAVWLNELNMLEENYLSP